MARSGRPIAVDASLRDAVPLPRLGEPPSRPATPWLVGFTRKELHTFTQQLRSTLELAEAAALHLNHRYIGTEYLLLGLLRLHDGFATEVLREQA